VTKTPIVVVFGATGFVGTATVDALRNRGAEVRTLRAPRLPLYGRGAGHGGREPARQSRSRDQAVRHATWGEAA